ncbi:site-specific recombinase XerD [Clostridium algifaecis]|uniref:Site-specific recombinase XerD n=1 Tax=Clostridium algifaecis TaxID=1472040 RepID=A0ABS4KV88_9CLOT|nr:site-specific integrase [Clostridium algifaecis]MBP2033306.1 site-specific recombinase XerD [Clostridium algifaecis]
MKNTETKIKYLTQQEAKSLFSTIESTCASHTLRDLSIFRIAYRCGLRASEISLLKLEDYNMDKGEIYCKRLKGSNNNTIRLDEKTKHILNKYIKKNGISSTSEILFKSQKNKPISRQTLNYLMKKYCSIANIEDKSKHHFHALKHTTAVHLAECDIDIKELQWWLGHKSVSNTEIYFQFTTKQQERMYAKLEGKSELV